MNRKKTVPGKRYKTFAMTSQGAIERLRTVLPAIDKTEITIAKVTAVYTDRMTVDVLSNDGLAVQNVRLLTRGGLENDEIWGEMEVPSVGTYVIVGFLEGSEEAPFVLGTVLPFLASLYQASQVAANSANKQFTLKLLEEIDPKSYRRIFKSGTTVEVAADGTLIVETPSGTYAQIDEAGGVVTIEDQHGNVVTLDSDGVKISATEIQLNGSSKTLVTHAELDAALQNLMNYINSHTHTITSGSSAGTTTSPVVPGTLDISSAEAASLKTDG